MDTRSRGVAFTVRTRTTVSTGNVRQPWTIVQGLLEKKNGRHFSQQQVTNKNALRIRPANKTSQWIEDLGRKKNNTQGEIIM